MKADNLMSSLRRTFLLMRNRLSWMVGCKQMNGVQPTQIVLMVCCGLHALQVTNLNAGANELKRTHFKGLSL